MNRTLDQYAKCDPFQVVSGSHAQALHFAKDAKADIAELAGENEMLRKALEACPLPSAMGNSATHYAKFYDWFNAHVVPALEAKP